MRTSATFAIEISHLSRSMDVRLVPLLTLESTQIPFGDAKKETQRPFRVITGS